jgi:hypothetical protein
MKDVGVAELFFGDELAHVMELFEAQIGALA